MICDWCKVQIQNKLLHWVDSFFFLLNHQEMWVSESFLCAISLQLMTSPTKPESRLYVHIWQNSHQIYKGNPVSLVVFHPWWHWPGHYPYHLRQNDHHPRQPCYHHQSCRRYSNYYTIFYIQQIINKLNWKAQSVPWKNRSDGGRVLFTALTLRQLREKNIYIPYKIK